MKKYKLLVCIIILALCSLMFFSCNSQQSQKPGSTNPNTTQKKEKTAVKVMEDLAEYKSLDMFGLLCDSVEEMAQNNFSDPEVVKWQLNADGDLEMFLKDGSSFKSGFLNLPSSYKDYAKLSENTPSSVKQDIVYGKSRLVSGLKVKEGSSEESQVVSTLKNAITEIKSELSSIANKSFTRVNTYSSQADFYNADDLADQGLVYGKNDFNSGIFGAVCSVRSDGSLLAYGVDKNLQLVEYYVSFSGSDMTEQEKKLAFLTGDVSARKTFIDISMPYYAPALDQSGHDQPIEDTVTVGEIYDQYFADVNFDAEFEAMLQRNYSTYAGQNLTTLFYTYENNKLTTYANSFATNTGYNTLTSAKFSVTPNSVVDSYLTDIKDKIIEQAEYEENDKVSKANINNIKNKLETSINHIREEIASTSLGAAEKKSYVSQNSEFNRQNEFAEKLFPGKEIVAAYVGSLAPMLDDSNKYFDAGYTTNFDITVAYKEGNNIRIYKANCAIPWRDGLSDQSLYNYFLNGAKDQTYKLRNEETTVVNNPHIVAEAEASAINSVIDFDFEDYEEYLQQTDL